MQFQHVKGRVHVLSHLPCAPRAKLSPSVAPHQAPYTPSALEHHLARWHSSQCVPAAGARRRRSARGSGCLQEPCSLPKEPGVGGIKMETPVCTLGPQPRALSRSSDPRALGLMDQQGEKWWRRPRMEKSRGL